MLFKKTCNRVISIVLSITLIFGSCPAYAFSGQDILPIQTMSVPVTEAVEISMGLPGAIFNLQQVADYSTAENDIDPDVYFPILYADYVEEPFVPVLSERPFELPDNPTFYTSARDVVLVLDVSGSMAGAPMNQLKNAAKGFCQSAISISSNVRIAVITYSTSATLNNNFTNNISSLTKTIDGLPAVGGTDIAAALLTANNLLNYHGRNAAVKTIILMTDGYPSNGSTYTGADAKYTTAEYGSYAPNASFVYNTARTMQHHEIITLGFFHDLTGNNLKLGRQLLADIQNKGYYDVVDGNNLDLAFKLIWGDIGGEDTGPGKDGFDSLGEGMIYDDEVQ